MRDIDTIILHMAATKPSMDVGADDIRRWHVAERGWDDIGYHYVIRRDGTIERGRPVETPGAHAYGHNKTSIGVCLVGGLTEDDDADCNFTKRQWDALERCVNDLMAQHGELQVIGHRDVSDKECPGFDAKQWWGK